MTETNNAAPKEERGYDVGYKKPPKATQYKAGDRGNPRGRPRGSLNKRTIIERALAQRVPVRKGDKTVKQPVLQAIVETFAAKALEGDHRAFAALVALVSKSGIWAVDSLGTTDGSLSERVPVAFSERPSDRWVEGLDDGRLSDDEKIALSKLAEKIDCGGDVTALDADDFMTFKQIVNKGSAASGPPAADPNIGRAA